MYSLVMSFSECLCTLPAPTHLAIFRLSYVNFFSFLFLDIFLFSIVYYIQHSSIFNKVKSFLFLFFSVYSYPNNIITKYSYQNNKITANQLFKRYKILKFCKRFWKKKNSARIVKTLTMLQENFIGIIFSPII